MMLAIVIPAKAGIQVLHHRRPIGRLKSVIALKRDEFFKPWMPASADMTGRVPQ